MPEGQSQPELCDECEMEHTSEAADMELLGRLLGDVRACVRYSPEEATQAWGPKAGTALLKVQTCAGEAPRRCPSCWTSWWKLLTGWPSLVMST